MSVKEDLLSGLKPALTSQIRSDLDSGRIKQPVELEVITKSTWHALRTNVQTAGALLVFGIKREEIDTLLREVFEDLKAKVK